MKLGMGDKMLDRAWERIASSINIQLINKLYVVELKIYNYFQGAGVIIKDMQRQKDCKKQKNWDWLEIVFSGYERTQIMKLKMSTFQNKYTYTEGLQDEMFQNSVVNSTLFSFLPFIVLSF